jgi:hypothetical protein
MKRKYEKKFWHWDFLWNIYPNMNGWFGDEWFWTTFYNPWLFNDDKADYVEHIWIPFFFEPIRINNPYTNMHSVIATDYEDFAVVYGCDNYWWILNYSYATFMSR